MSRTLFYEDDNLRVTYEVIQGNLFVHAILHTFSKAILTKMKEVWWEFRCRAWFEGYNNIFTYTKDDRMARVIGNAHEVGQDNKSLHQAGVRMYRWDLIQQA